MVLLGGHGPRWSRRVGHSGENRTYWGSGGVRRRNELGCTGVRTKITVNVEVHTLWREIVRVWYRSSDRPRGRVVEVDEETVPLRRFVGRVGQDGGTGLSGRCRVDTQWEGHILQRSSGRTEVKTITSREPNRSWGVIGWGRKRV